MKRDCQCPRANHVHGSRRAYVSDRCRCLPCRAAHARSATAYRTGQSWIEDESGLPAVGVRRRLQALTVIGWTARALADETGISYDMIGYLRGGSTHRTVSRDLYQRVTDAYDRLWDKPRTDINARRASTQARKAGWLPPAGLDDDLIDRDDLQISYSDFNNSDHDEIPEIIDGIAVERACLGDRVRLTKAEMSCAIDTLTRMGHSADEIARRLRISDRTVLRYRKKEAA